MTSTAVSEWLARVRADPRRALLAFDFDGTLAPIVADPGEAVAHPRVPGLLQQLVERVGHVAVITGRPAGLAVSRLGLDGRSETGSHRASGGPPRASYGEIVVLGHYGLERWDSGRGEVRASPPHEGLRQVWQELPGVLTDAQAADAYVEDKTASVAVHTRRLAEPLAAFQRLRAPLADLAARNGLVLEPGRLVLELRPPGVDKGAALRDVVAESDATTVSFAGDDLGDLAAFDVVDALRGEGVRGLLVCSGSTEEQALVERADLVLDGPDGVVDWLQSLLTELPEQSPAEPH